METPRIKKSNLEPDANACIEVGDEDVVERVEDLPPKTPPAPTVPAQQPSGNWNPDIDTADQDWTNH